MSEHEEGKKPEVKNGRKTFLPEAKNLPPPPKNSGPDRCELCIYWHMRDPRQKCKSCFDRGYEAHDVCQAFYRKPERLRHDTLQHIQNLSSFEVNCLFDVLNDRMKQIAWMMKTAIRLFIRKTGGAVVYWRDEDGKRKSAKVERVTASSVMLKKNKAGVEKIRVTEVIEAISRAEYKARKNGSVTEKDPGRKIK